jgi:hypothetical protein
VGRIEVGIDMFEFESGLFLVVIQQEQVDRSHPTYCPDSKSGG